MVVNNEKTIKLSIERTKHFFFLNLSDKFDLLLVIDICKYTCKCYIIVQEVKQAIGVGLDQNVDHVAAALKCLFNTETEQISDEIWRIRKGSLKL